jgi:hypothetical protein
MRTDATTSELPSQSEAVLSAGDRSPGQDALDAMDLRVRAAVAAQFRLMRRRSGLTLAHVAARASTHRPIVGRIERGLHTVRLDTAKRIAEANGGSLREVLEAVDVAIGMRGAP